MIYTFKCISNKFIQHTSGKASVWNTHFKKLQSPILIPVIAPLDFSHVLIIVITYLGKLYSISSHCFFFNSYVLLSAVQPLLSSQEATRILGFSNFIKCSGAHSSKLSLFFHTITRNAWGTYGCNRDHSVPF